MPIPNAFGARAPLGAGLPDRYRLDALATSGIPLGVDLGRAPATLKILLENALRHAGGGIVREDDVVALAAWRPGGAAKAPRKRGFSYLALVVQASAMRSYSPRFPCCYREACAVWRTRRGCAGFGR